MLESRCPAAQISSMLGRVVDDKYDPNFSFAPKATLAPSSILPALNPDPQKSENHTEFLQVMTGTGLRARLGELFHVDVGQRTETQLRFHSDLVRRYEIDHPEVRFAALMKDERYADEVRMFLRASTHGLAYMVTGLMTATNTIWGFSEKKNIDVSVGADVPLAVLTGAPVPDVGFDVSPLSNEMCREGEATVVSEEIFAISYIVVKLERSGIIRRRGEPAAGGVVWASNRDCALSTSLSGAHRGDAAGSHDGLGLKSASDVDDVSKEEISVREVTFVEGVDFVIDVESVVG